MTSIDAAFWKEAIQDEMDSRVYLTILGFQLTYLLDLNPSNANECCERNIALVDQSNLSRQEQ